MLKDLDIYHQVAGQVYFTNRAVEQGLSEIQDMNWLSVSYEEFCKSPQKIYRQLKERLSRLGYDVAPRYSGPKSFESTNQVRLSKQQFNLISKAYEEFLGNFG